MTQPEIDALHTYLDNMGYKKAEFADDMWVFCYGVYDEWKARKAKETSIRQSIMRALDTERRRVRKESSERPS